MNIAALPEYRTVADLLRSLGDIPAERVRFDPIPGTAVVADLLHPANKGCELVDGILVEKAVGWEESFLASWLLMVMNQHVLAQNLGAVTGEDGTVQLFPDIARAPDVAFTSWDRMPGRRRPSDRVPLLAPDLAVEVLSASNTPGEMARKRDEYFRAGVRLVWEVDPRIRTVRVYSVADQFEELFASDTLTGGSVLPGFAVPLADLFGELDRHG